MKLNKARIFAVLLLVLALLILGTAIVYPFVQWFNAGMAQIEELAFRIARLRRVAQTVGQWQARVEEIQALTASEGQFLEGATPALAAAELQTRIKQVIEEAGGTLASVQASAPREEEGFTRVGVRVNLSGTVYTLRKVLYAIESSRPYLLVSTLNINPDRSRQAQAGQLRMDLEIYGYLKPK